MLRWKAHITNTHDGRPFIVQQNQAQCAVCLYLQPAEAKPENRDYRGAVTRFVLEEDEEAHSENCTNKPPEEE